MNRDNWTPERLTPRDVVVDGRIVVSASCSGCRYIVEMNVWRIGARLADDPFQTMRFRCRRCGAYATSIQVSRRTMAEAEKLLTIPLKPRCWDEGHDEKQRAALARLAASQNPDLSTPRIRR